MLTKSSSSRGKHEQYSREGRFESAFWISVSKRWFCLRKISMNAALIYRRRFVLYLIWFIYVWYLTSNLTFLKNIHELSNWKSKLIWTRPCHNFHSQHDDDNDDDDDDDNDDDDDDDDEGDICLLDVLFALKSKYIQTNYFKRLLCLRVYFRQIVQIVHFSYKCIGEGDI